MTKVIEVDPRMLNIDIDELEEGISEVISADTGFCHTGFSYKIIVTAELDTSE